MPRPYSDLCRRIIHPFDKKTLGYILLLFSTVTVLTVALMNSKGYARGGAGARDWILVGGISAERATFHIRTGGGGGGSERSLDFRLMVWERPDRGEGSSTTIYHAVVELDLGGAVAAVDVTGLTSDYTYL